MLLLRHIAEKFSFKIQNADLALGGQISEKVGRYLALQPSKSTCMLLFIRKETRLRGQQRNTKIHFRVYAHVAGTVTKANGELNQRAF